MQWHATKGSRSGRDNRKVRSRVVSRTYTTWGEGSLICKKAAVYCQSNPELQNRATDTGLVEWSQNSSKSPIGESGMLQKTKDPVLRL